MVVGLTVDEINCTRESSGGRRVTRRVHENRVGCSGSTGLVSTRLERIKTQGIDIELIPRLDIDLKENRLIRYRLNPVVIEVRTETQRVVVIICSKPERSLLNLDSTRTEVRKRRSHSPIWAEFKRFSPVLNTVFVLRIDVVVVAFEVENSRNDIGIHNRIGLLAAEEGRKQMNNKARELSMSSIGINRNMHGRRSQVVRKNPTASKAISERLMCPKSVFGAFEQRHWAS